MIRLSQHDKGGEEMGYFEKYVKKGQARIKKKDLPRCPICGAPAFLRHDFYGKEFLDRFPEGSMERRAFQAYLDNNKTERIDAGYSCGCSEYKPHDGIHGTQMAINLKTRNYCLTWWLRKVDQFLGDSEI